MLGRTVTAVALALVVAVVGPAAAGNGFDRGGGLAPVPPPNSPPVLGPIGNKVVAAGSWIEFTVEATDADNDALQYTARRVPAGAGFDAPRRLFAWRPTLRQRGRHLVTVSVSDGRKRVSKTIAIVVAGEHDCEGCHGGGGVVHPGLDGIPCTDDDAPNVMTAHAGYSWLSVWDGTWWDTVLRGDNATQQGGHGDPDGAENGDASRTPTCRSCHDVSDPPGTHRDGIYNSLGSELPRGSVRWRPQDCSPTTPRPIGSTNENTAHLRRAFFTRYPANGAGDYRWQVAMDNYCYRECHQFNGISDMRHEKDTAPTDVGHWSVELGTHSTADVPRFSMIDADVTTDAAGLPNYAPCVACHNPHGSTVTHTKRGGPGGTNHMLTGSWRSPQYCENCHR